MEKGHSDETWLPSNLSLVLQTVRNLWRLAFAQQITLPIIALTIASAVCVTLVAARVLLSRNFHYTFLIWNLILAWLPLVFSLLACEYYRKRSARSWHFMCAFACWLLFLPNAPYIFTDVIHLVRGHRGHFWVDLFLILSCAVTGLVLGFVSLFLMQNLIVKGMGRFVGWIFIATIAGLSGIGIFIGRFLRLNSWDVVLKPWALPLGMVDLLAHPRGHMRSLALAALFGLFLFIAYLMLYALTHLRISQQERLLEHRNLPGT
jgi:uncharacterized membrane protein